MFDVRRIVARFPAAVSKSAVEPTKPPIWRKPATVSRGLKRKGRDLDHSSHILAILHYTPPYTFMTSRGKTLFLSFFHSLTRLHTIKTMWRTSNCEFIRTFHNLFIIGGSVLDYFGILYRFCNNTVSEIQRTHERACHALSHRRSAR